MKAPKSSTGKSTSSSSSLTATISKPRSSSSTATQSCGPCQVGDSVLFVELFPQAKSVQIAGDFNDWKPERNQLRKASDDSWQCRIPMSKGIHRYRLVVDGSWQQDPYNDHSEPNPFGGNNSVLKVE